MPRFLYMINSKLGIFKDLYFVHWEEQNMFTKVVAPIVALLNQMTGPLLAVVGAVGALYCVFLGVKFAKAEEPQEREKSKTALKNSIIGFVLIFVLILALNLSMPILIDWVNGQQTGTIIVQ